MDTERVLPGTVATHPTNARTRLTTMCVACPKIIPGAAQIAPNTKVITHSHKIAVSSGTTIRFASTPYTGIT